MVFSLLLSVDSKKFPFVICSSYANLLALLQLDKCQVSAACFAVVALFMFLVLIACSCSFTLT